MLVGANAIAGEWGYNPLPRLAAADQLPPACYCGHRAVSKPISGPGHDGRSRPPNRQRLAANHREHARSAWRQRLRNHPAPLRSLGRAASVINILDPQVIVLGGGLCPTCSGCTATCPHAVAPCVFPRASTTPACCRRAWRFRPGVRAPPGCGIEHCRFVVLLNPGFPAYFSAARWQNPGSMKHLSFIGGIRSAARIRPPHRHHKRPRRPVLARQASSATSRPTAACTAAAADRCMLYPGAQLRPPAPSASRRRQPAGIGGIGESRRRSRSSAMSASATSGAWAAAAYNSASRATRAGRSTKFGCDGMAAHCRTSPDRLVLAGRDTRCRCAPAIPGPRTRYLQRLYAGRRHGLAATTAPAGHWRIWRWPAWLADNWRTKIINRIDWLRKNTDQTPCQRGFHVKPENP